LPATDATRRIGALVINPGGPGASGVDAAYDLALDLPDELKARFDLVGFDPRGVGQSEPVVCTTDKEKDKAFALDPTPDTRAEIDALVEAELKANDGCVAASGDLLPYLSTYDSARDLDRIRQALGEDQLTFLGFSYGTHLGATYAELFPGSIRAMVLDGPVNPVTGFGQDDTAAADSGDGFEGAFKRFTEACTAAATCPAKPDAGTLRDKLTDKVEKDPIPASLDDRKLTSGLLDTAVGAALYDEGSWPFLAVGLVDADKGDGSVLMALADSYVGRDPDGHYDNLDDAFRVINCADIAERIDPVRVRENAAALAVPPDPDELGNVLDEASCSGLPAGDTPFKPLSAKGAVPIVVIGTKGDPATVVTNAPKLAKALGSGVTVIWDGDGHTAFPKTTCISDLVSRYLIDLTAPKDDTHCPADDPAEATGPSTSVASADGVSTYRLVREDYREGLTSQLTDALGSADSATCVFNAMVAKFDDTQFVHAMIGVDLDGLFKKIQTIVAGC
jgi:pimeloyl-ACP methyl ester carboxylesterase